MLAAAAALLFVGSALVAFNGWPVSGILGSSSSIQAPSATQVAYIAPGARRIADQAGDAAASVAAVPHGPAVASGSAPAGRISGSLSGAQRVSGKPHGTAGNAKGNQGGAGSSNTGTSNHTGGDGHPLTNVTKVLDDSHKNTASTVGKVGDNVGSTVTKTTSSVGNTVHHTGDSVGNTVSKVSPPVGQAVQSTTAAVDQTLTNTGTVLGSTVAGVGQTLAGALGGTGP